MWSRIVTIIVTLLINLDAATAFAAAGGGGGFGASKATPKNLKKNNKNRKRGGLISEEISNKRSANEAKQDITLGEDQQPKLDRFGLPILTAENFFPKLPPETVLEYVIEGEETNLETIQKSMQGCIQLDYSLFDNNGVEKAIDSNSKSKPWKLKLLHKSPPVLSIENFFTDNECDEYIDLTKDPEKEQTSTSSSDKDSTLKINSATFSTLAYSKRTSTTWYCHYRQVATLLSKAKRLLNKLPLEQMEEAQIVRYRTGEEFSWHYDEIPTEQLWNGGQRIATLLVYLNALSDTGGGGTIFRDLKGVGGIGELTMRPKKGSALLFFPATADGKPDDRTLHKGEVALEEKMIAQMWIHESKYRPVIPEGNTHEAAIDLVKEKEAELGYVH